MNDASFVCSLKRLANLLCDIERFFEWNGTACNALREGLPFDELENKEPTTVDFFEIVDRGDVGMIERGQNFGFALESTDAIANSRELVRQDLDRYTSIELRITCAVHLTHSAFAKQSGNFVGAELCADGQSHDFACDYRTQKVSGRITALPNREVLRRKTAQSESSVSPEHFRLGGL